MYTSPGRVLLLSSDALLVRKLTDALPGCFVQRCTDLAEAGACLERERFDFVVAEKVSPRWVASVLPRGSSQATTTAILVRTPGASFLPGSRPPARRTTHRTLGDLKVLLDSYMRGRGEQVSGTVVDLFARLGVGASLCEARTSREALGKAVMILMQWPEVLAARAYVQDEASRMVPLLELSPNRLGPRLVRDEQEIAALAWRQGPFWLETNAGWLHAFPRPPSLGPAAVVLTYLENVYPWHVHLIGTICRLCFVSMSLCAMRDDVGLRQKEADEAESERDMLRRSAATGLLAVGVLHDMGNVLCALRNRVYLLRERRAKSPSALLQRMSQDLNRAERLIRIGLSTACKPAKPPAALRVRALLDKSIELARLGSDFRNITLSRRIEPAARKVVCRPEEVCAALRHILANAAEAMPQGGKIQIVTDRAGDFVHIKVSDSGAGIDESYGEKVFAPFFSTKPGGQGLGLSIAREIIRCNRGDISFQSVRGKGTTFTIRLPSRYLRSWRSREGGQ